MDKIKVIVFRVRERFFGLSSGEVKEIVESEQVLKKIFYDRGGALRGLIDYEGSPISVLDSSELLDVEEEGDEPLILICRESKDSDAVGITASAVVGMEVIDRSDIKVSPEEEANFTVGFVKEGRGARERVITILNLGKFFTFVSEKFTDLGVTGAGANNQ